MKFLADRMLGKLAKALRMLGYDTIYYRWGDTTHLIQLAREEGRVILTRNTKLLPKKPEDHIVRIIEDKLFLQVKELIQKELISFYEDRFLSRCLLCNNLLDEIPREEAEGKVPDFVFTQQKDFSRCPQCHRIYWQGSHPEHMQKKMKELFR